MYYEALVEIIEEYIFGQRDSGWQRRPWVDDSRVWTDVKTFHTLKKWLKIERNGSSWFPVFVSKMALNGDDVSRSNSNAHAWQIDVA